MLWYDYSETELQALGIACRNSILQDLREAY